jgi:hypothetical protein
MKNGFEISKKEFDSVTLEKGMRELPCVLLDNGAFHAILVCDTQHEFDYARKDLNDLRPKSYWLIGREALEGCTDIPLSV